MCKEYFCPSCSTSLNNTGVRIRYVVEKVVYEDAYPTDERVVGKVLLARCARCGTSVEKTLTENW